MARPPPSTPPRRSRTAVAPVRARSVVTDSGSLQNAFSSYFPYASSSYDPARFLPSLASLQAWVYRPDAVAKCFTSDVLNLRALKSDDGDVQYKSSDVFLLNHFPCKNIEVYGWVAAVEHKDDTVVLTLDDGDGENTLTVNVRLAKVAVEQPPRSPKKASLATPTPDSPTKTGTFLSARERKAARKAAAAAQAKVERAAAAAAAAKKVWRLAEKVYVRPDIRIGDTVRVVGHLNEYSFNKRFGPAEVIRNVVVDAASGSGSVEVVDPERLYYHHAEAAELHETRYSRPFVMPAPPVPSSARSSPARSMHSSPVRPMGSSPAKSILSSIGSSDAGDYSDEEEKDAFDRQLGDPAKLPSKLLTHTTFRLYALDHMTKTTVRAMMAATRRDSPYYAPIPVLRSLFPEYAAVTKGKTLPSPPRRDMFGPLPVQQLPTPSSSGDETMETPRATFHSKRKRDAAASPTKTPVARILFRSRSQREHERERDGRDADRSDYGYDQSMLSSLSSDLPASHPSLLPFTPQSLLDVPALHALATRIADNDARQNEIARRRRAETGTQTAADLQTVAKRKAAGKNSGSYALTRDEREGKMLTLATATIRQVHRDGGVVAVDQGYLPLPPELLAPLLAPVVSEARQVHEMKHNANLSGAIANVSTSGIFRSRRERELERQREWGASAGSSSFASLCPSSTGGSSLGSMSLYSTAGSSAPSARRVAARLTRWCERWERVSVDAVERALTWGDENGLL